jgi:hypothetical protein
MKTSGRQDDDLAARGWSSLASGSTAAMASKSERERLAM